MAAPPVVPNTQPGMIYVPRLVTDPVWSLRPWPVLIRLDGKELEVPALSAAEWLSVLMVAELDPEDILPGLLSEADEDLVEEALYQGAVGIEELYELALQVVATVSARPWWVTLRLIGIARTSWDSLGGEMMSKADPARLALAGWLDILFLAVVRGCEESKRQMLLLQLEAPPPSVLASQQGEMVMSEDAFMALARSS